MLGGIEYTNKFLFHISVILVVALYASDIQILRKCRNISYILEFIEY